MPFLQLAELIEDEEELAEIDTSNIVWTGRRRNAPLDYSSEEALNKAGLNSGAAAAEQEEDDAEFHVSETAPSSGRVPFASNLIPDLTYTSSSLHAWNDHLIGRRHGRPVTASHTDMLQGCSNACVEKKIQLQLHEPSTGLLDRD